LKRLLLAFISVTGILCGAQNAKNLILFLGDGTGIPTLNAASIYGYGEARALYIQNMPYIGLSDTSTAAAWVGDSAAGMTAIVTGQKTNNGVISQTPDGKILKTILEYAEEHGLATGVVSNSSMSDATPAACYAHSRSRTRQGEIFAQVLSPSFGDGVDLIIGAGRRRILQLTAERGLDLSVELPRKGYLFLDNPGALNGLDPTARRVVALFNSDEFDLGAVVDQAITILSRNPSGFFLMVESNNHFDDAEKTLQRTVTFDKIIRRVAERLRSNSLIMFTADHSFDLRLAGGKKGQDILPLVRVEGGHTAEEVLAAAEGPGAERVHGIFPNTHLFYVMLTACGWKE
jgi:alkaline phosphatase